MKPEADTLVSGTGLSKVWPTGTALAPIDIELRAGELVALPGRSGSGKSTLLAIISGWCAPTTGVVRFASDISPEHWRAVAVVPQALGLIPELTMRENVEFPGRAQMSSEELDRVPHLMETLGIADLQGRFPAETSLGQQQRTALARALVTRPNVLLIDEPTSHQDADNATAVLEAIEGLTRFGTAVLMATHDPQAIEASHRTIDLDEMPTLDHAG